jgi:hypothetical protein
MAADAQTGLTSTVTLQNGATQNAPCNPCGSLAGALGTVAPGGNIYCVNGGNFWPQTTITASITIDCHDVLATVVSCGAITINAPGASVTLRNITFMGQDCGSNGIIIQAAAAVHLEDVTVSHILGAGVIDTRTAGSSLVIKNMTIRDNSGDGIRFTPSAAIHLHVSDSLITSNGTSGLSAGITIKPGSGITATATIERSKITGNLFGIFADGTGGGSVRGTIASSTVGENTANGISANTNGTNVGLMVDNTVVSGNNNGLAVGGTNGFILVRRSSITANSTGLSAGGGGALVTYRDNTVNNNTTDGAFSFAISTQ